MFGSTRLEINHNNVESFETFNEGWIVRQEQYLQELVQSIQVDNSNNSEENDARRKELITRVVAHYTDYYHAKGRVAQENVFLLFAPNWFSSYERTYLWITGFRPSIVFRVLSGSVLDFTEDQSRRISLLTAEIKEKENELNDVLSRVQEWMVTPQMVALATQMGRLQDGALADMESLFERLRNAMETLVECADYTRGKTVVKILEILKLFSGIDILGSCCSISAYCPEIWNASRCGGNITPRNRALRTHYAFIECKLSKLINSQWNWNPWRHVVCIWFSTSWSSFISCLSNSSQITIRYAIAQRNSYSYMNRRKVANNVSLL